MMFHVDLVFVGLDAIGICVEYIVSCHVGWRFVGSDLSPTYPK